MRKLLTRIARPLEVILGVVFLIGAVLKAQDLNLFSVQINAYGVISSKNLLPIAALAALAVELLLGCALLFRVRLRMFTYVAVEGLLAFFTLLILYGWIFHDLKNCGCFGPLEVSPGISIAKNAVLAAIAGAAAIGVVLSGTEVRARAPRLRLLLAAIAVAGTAGITAYGYWDLNRQAVHVVEGKPGPFASFVFDLPEGHFDLGKGEYLVAMLSMDCEHCMESVPLLNEFLYQSGFPPIVGICLEEQSGDLEEFRAITGPQFPLYSIGDQVRLFFNLIGKEPPRISYVRNGHQAAFWDERVPTPEELAAAIAAAKALPDTG